MKVLTSVYRRLLKLEFWRWKHVDTSVVGLFGVLLALDTATHILLKTGVNALGPLPMQDLAAALGYLGGMLQQPAIWLGGAALLLAFVTWLAIIARIDLSKAHPATAFSYVTVTLASGWLLGEHVSLLQVGGILLIMLGVFLVAE